MLSFLRFIPGLLKAAPILVDLIKALLALFKTRKKKEEETKKEETKKEEKEDNSTERKSNVRTSEKGLNFIKESEGLRLKSYLCSGKVWTIGWGTTVYPNGEKVRSGQTCTKEQAQEYFKNDMKIYEQYVKDSCVYIHTETQNQFDALVSFVYNVGKGGLHAPNSIDRRIRNGEDFKTVISEELPRWNKADGKYSPGLASRRQRELDMFFDKSLPADIKIAFNTVSDEVKLFQKMLNSWLKKWSKKELSVDGIFGPGTLLAIKDFQRNNKLPERDYVSNDCWDKVESFYNNEVSDPIDTKPVDDFFRWKRGENPKLSENFSAAEFQCKCGNCVEQKIEKELVRRVQLLREKLQTPLYVNSGLRCPDHNRRVGGVPNSRHVVGDAADLSCSRTPGVIAAEYDALGFRKDSGVGVYSSFTHVDTRGYEARW